jgi:CRISPR-associated protein Cst2
MKTNSITITYLAKVSFASLNGGDKEVDNINTIKKVTLENGDQLPYMSAQAVRRALRDKLKELGWSVSPVGESSEAKGAAKTACDPEMFIDDDLFGFMDAAKTGTLVRTSPIRVEALVALSKFQDDLDFGTNYMAKDAGGNPNIFETEIHSGLYRGTLLIELDRVGNEREGQGKKTFDISNEEKAARVIALLNSFQMLWSSGRQSRFLADISPKFVAAALMRSKNPIFLETLKAKRDGQVDVESLKSVTKDYAAFIDQSILATQEGVFAKNDDVVVSLAEGFETITGWINAYYGISKS